MTISGHPHARVDPPRGAPTPPTRHGWRVVLCHVVTGWRILRIGAGVIVLMILAAAMGLAVLCGILYLLTP